MMKEQPNLKTQRLVLRPFNDSDAPLIHQYANDPEMANNTLNIPHPYPDGAAEQFLQQVRDDYESGNGYYYAITLNDDFIGSFSMRIVHRHERGEIGYWIGRPFWGYGYMTEAGHALLSWAFGTVGVQRIHATHFTHNIASGRVMQKIGMKYEGTLRRHVQRDGKFYDLVYYGILRDEFEV